MPIKRPVEDMGESCELLGLVPLGLLASYPNVLEYMSASRYDDGALRQTSTMVLCVDQGALKACLNDRDRARSLWASGASLEDVLRDLEEDLSSGTGAWRSYAGGKKPRK